MEFYKLFHIVHRRTDWNELFQWQRKTIMQEWYEERERRGCMAVQKLLLCDSIIRTFCRNSHYLN